MNHPHPPARIAAAIAASMLLAAGYAAAAGPEPTDSAGNPVFHRSIAMAGNRALADIRSELGSALHAAAARQLRHPWALAGAPGPTAFAVASTGEKASAARMSK